MEFYSFTLVSRVHVLDDVDTLLSCEILFVGISILDFLCYDYLMQFDLPPHFLLLMFYIFSRSTLFIISIENDHFVSKDQFQVEIDQNFG